MLKTRLNSRKVVDIDSAKVTMKGEDGKENVSTWSDGCHVFSITVNCGGTGLDSTTIYTLVRQ